MEQSDFCDGADFNDEHKEKLDFTFKHQSKIKVLP